MADTKYYSIEFHGDRILTLVTSSAAIVERWILNIYHLHRHRLHKLIIGLDTQYLASLSPNTSYPVATIQLCVGHRCLIFQCLHADAIPATLVNFLGNKNFTFVGVGIRNDAKKLMNDHGLRVVTTRDVADGAAEKYKESKFRIKGLKNLALELLGLSMEKPMEITLSAWNASNLSQAQVEYACHEAYVAYLLGMKLYKVEKYPSAPIMYYMECAFQGRYSNYNMPMFPSD
ncbi:hypothetical protein L6164_007643 [Bauhinia variegata]|uniref:Uncharacterized protein n=1 Tax=Bauhinia variegata TaxID=167791 RepID=A0ACB9PJQ9_BAUVA|nr:hypothetical protein L6164_007643 [Bauhinia variegata]